MPNSKPTVGFSLIELLVTLALLIVMVSLMYGRGSKMFQRQQKAVCRERMATLYVGLQLYANDAQGHFPVVSNAVTSELPLALLIPRYTSTTEPFICPGTKRNPIPEGKPLSEFGISYAYYMGREGTENRQPLLTDAQVDDNEKHVGGTIFSKEGKGKGANHHQYGGNILFTDGSTVEIGTEAQIEMTHQAGIKLLNPK